MSNFKSLLLIVLSMLCLTSSAQRVKYSINDAWRFSSTDNSSAAASIFDDSSWETISIPHCWNALDAIDETPEYYRGKGWYRKTLTLNDISSDKLTYIYFEGANQKLELYINDTRVGEHIGGYTAFCFDITPYIKKGDNSIAISLDNSHQPTIPPLGADFTFFGGIYRDVYIIQTPTNHISTTDYASSGVYIKTPSVSESEATVEIRTILTNASASKESLFVESTIVTSLGEVVAHSRQKADAQSSRAESTSRVKIVKPQLWSPSNPNLYKVYTKIVDAKGNELDCVVNPLGLRWYEFDPQKGFFVNGKHLKLIGTCRHQDYYKKGNALEDQMHIRDIELIKKMGGNFLRVSHYPQDPAIMQMCDKLGIITSVEIPVVNEVTIDDRFLNNSMQMLSEMVYQNMNSPSVVIWAYMNEIMIRQPYLTDTSVDKQEYLKYVYKVASSLDAELRRIDPARYTMMAFHGSGSIYAEAKLTEIPQIHGWNMYSGWYGGKFSGFEKTLDKLRAVYPDKILMVSEYGADVDTRLHSFDSESFDFSCEYGVKMHQHYIREIIARDCVSISSLWNLNDFYSELRSDAVPHVNNKGITGLDRARKDSYFLYQAYLSDKPMVHIGNSAWTHRMAQGDEKGIAVQLVNIYSNTPQTELFINGRSLGIKSVKERVAQYDVPFTDGMNVLEAVGYADNDTVKDLCKIDFKVIAPQLNSPHSSFSQINVMLGSKRYFEQRESECCWMPEKPYEAGSWGYIGGKPLRIETRYGTLPAASNDILGTEDDPLFQTQREGIESFRADVSDGEYSVYLYFAELTSDKQPSGIVFNLGNDAVALSSEERVFNVSINNIRQITNMNLAREHGANRAVIKKFVVTAKNRDGVRVDFESVSGKPILNAIKIVRNY